MKSIMASVGTYRSFGSLEKNKELGKTRFIWLKNPENLSEREIQK
jgi:hypothetical protein